jgi:hypothetical protein
MVLVDVAYEALSVDILSQLSIQVSLQRPKKSVSIVKDTFVAHQDDGSLVDRHIPAVTLMTRHYVQQIFFGPHRIHSMAYEQDVSFGRCLRDCSHRYGTFPCGTWL